MPNPTFTVIVPTFERREPLRRCLLSLNAQTLPRAALEVVVVFDDDTGEVDEQAIAATCPGLEIHVVRQPHRGPAAARNRGAEIAGGRYLAFTDDDCRPAPDWLMVLQRHLSRAEDTVAVGGRVVNVLESNIFASASQTLVDFLYAYYNEPPTQARLLTSNNLCIPAAAFRDMGGFDETFDGAGGEDRELCLRWCHEGRRLIYAPDAVVEHLHDMTLKQFLRQHLTYGKGGWRLRERAAAHGFGPIRLEPIDFYKRLLTYPLRSHRTAHPWRIAGLFAVSQIATGAGYVRARFGAKR